MFDCTTSRYDRLYARWLKDAGSLLDWCKYSPTQHLLVDLCGGSGAISKIAEHRGASGIVLVDKNPRYHSPNITTLKSNAETLDGFEGLNLSRQQPYFVVCRQAINYTDIDRVASRLYEVCPPGSHFVFNTFARPRWKFQSYLHDGAWFVEISASFFQQVLHVQMRNGIFDLSLFHHYDLREYGVALVRNGWKFWKVLIDGNSVRIDVVKEVQ